VSADWSRYAEALPSIAAAVGHTPLVRLARVTADVGPAIYVKVEWYGATGSLKDRIYLHMFERAERRGALHSGMTVLECSIDNPDNVETHFLTTGPEIWEQMGGAIGAFVDAQGSGGTLTGVGRYLRQRDPRVKLYAVEPAECALLARREWGHHGIEGIGDGFVPENLDLSLLSGVITATTGESVETARRLAAEEGIFCGISSGCNVAAAIKLARRRPELPSVVTMANDT